MIDHRSPRRFSTGVPVRARRRPQRSSAAARDWAVPGFFTCCASSRTTLDHSIGRRWSRSRASSEYVVRTTSCAAALGPNSSWWSWRAGPVMDHNRQPRGEASQLPFPVPQHRYGAHHQCRAGAGVGEHGGDHLCGLPEPHVVGQAGAESEPAQERHPADPSLLVGAELRLEPIRGGHRRDSRVYGVVEKRLEPTSAAGVDVCDFETLRQRQVTKSKSRSHQFGRGRPVGVPEASEERLYAVRRGSQPTGPAAAPAPAWRPLRGPR